MSIHQYPTNYSVSTNEDIFEYIKFDILYELLSKPIQLEKLELDTLQAVAHLEYDDFKDIIKSFLKLILVLGKALEDVKVVRFNRIIGKIPDIVQIFYKSIVSLEKFT